MQFRHALHGLLAVAATAVLVACGGGAGYGGVSPIVSYSVGGTLSGSVGPVLLRLNGGSDITLANPGAFTFSQTLANGSAYAVTASGDQNCRVANGTGVMGTSNIGNVTVTCTTVVRSAALTGAQENPPTGSAATGRGALIVDPVTREVTGGFSFSGVTPTAGGHHIHQAPSGSPTQNGPVIIPLTLAPGGGVATVPAGTVLSAAQYAAYLAGELYFNVHSAAFPNGEIRGQINGRNGITAGLATLDGGHETPPNASVASGRGSIVFDSATREVLVAYVTHNVSGATVAHIHTGAPGVAGPPDVVTLTAGIGFYTAPNPSTLTPANVTDLNAGNTYFNVHSGAFPNGEIRGQIAVQ